MADDTSNPQSESARPEESRRQEPIADPAQPHLAPSSQSLVSEQSLASPSHGEPDITQSEIAVSAQPAAPVLTLREKHPLATRWMHWLNFPLLGLMIWSGLMIYWADSEAGGMHAHQVYRIGIGHWTLFRLFPDSFYNRLGLTFSLAKGLSWHFFLTWLFGINGLLYVLYTFISGAWRDLLPGRNALRDAYHILLHDLHLRRELPSQGLSHSKYNAAQQIAYTLIILAGAGSILTGLAIYKPTQLHWLTTLLGGYEFARFLHFWLTMGYVVFFVIHVLQVAIAGWNNFRGMVAGFELASVRQEEQR
jgi:thiosulfate reductase cytochrome b subunit